MQLSCEETKTVEGNPVVNISEKDACDTWSLDNSNEVNDADIESAITTFMDEHDAIKETVHTNGIPRSKRRKIDTDLLENCMNEEILNVNNDSVCDEIDEDLPIFSM